MKSISISNATILENTDCSIIKACTPVIDLKVEVLLGHSIPLRFISSYFEQIG